MRCVRLPQAVEGHHIAVIEVAENSRRPTLLNLSAGERMPAESPVSKLPDIAERNATAELSMAQARIEALRAA
jgi:hypothetical protein